MNKKSVFLITLRVQLKNSVILASAGSGKTTEIINRAASDSNSRAAIVNYTIKGREEIYNKIYSKYGHIPPHLAVDTWFSFLLKHFVRPYQNMLYDGRVRTIHFVTGRSNNYSKASDIDKHYFSKPGLMYSDKVSKFACELIAKTGGAPITRFAQIFGRLYIDESQDLAGYDLDLIEALLRSNVEVTLVGDHRQATYSTHSSGKHTQYLGDKIVNKFIEWEKANLCTIEHQYISHRCIQTICDFADQFHPVATPTISTNQIITGHDGIFAITLQEVEPYFEQFKPQPLRYDRRTSTIGIALNYGESKGLTFERTLIYPHGKLKKFLITGDIKDAGSELEKIYVAITRAKQSATFVVDDTSKVFVPSFSF